MVPALDITIMIALGLMSQPLVSLGSIDLQKLGGKEEDGSYFQKGGSDEPHYSTPLSGSVDESTNN